MQIARLIIENFRGVQSSTIHFNGHTLLVGPNNVGKSTICEALDLVLGPDRLRRQPPVDEFDFYNSEYLKRADSDELVIVPIRIEVVMIDLSDELLSRCGANIEFWLPDERRLLGVGEVDLANSPTTIPCLRLECVAKYDPAEDDFDAKTFYSHGNSPVDGELVTVPQNIKKLFGFLYLRALRTGSRALSLERGSLLDVILRLKGARTGLWESTIATLKGISLNKADSELDEVLLAIEERLNRYISKSSTEQGTRLFVSQLTREHLRKTLSFFLTMSADQEPVPFQHVGTGTLNALVLALLSFIAELKPDSVIFAMEEPEIAVPPHTQRRIIEYLLGNTHQAFVTSHSPFVIERFEPASILVLTREVSGRLDCKKLSEAKGLNDMEYRRYARRGITECMLGKGVVIVEGVTEFYALPVVARRLADSDPKILPLDLSGVSFFDAESDGKILKFGQFFSTLGLQVFGFRDRNDQHAAKKDQFNEHFLIDHEHEHKSFEHLLAEEMAPSTLWAFLEEIRRNGDNGNLPIPESCPDTKSLKKLVVNAFGSKKGAGWGARLFESCSLDELPITIVEFLRKVYEFFPPPKRQETRTKPIE